jgi:hypothetical protein
MQVDLLYFDGCPSWEDAMRNMMAALEMEGLKAEVRLIQVNDDNKAVRLKFLGSPSFQVDGEDLWSEHREQYALSCRVYVTPQGMKGAPTTGMLREKLNALKSK